MPSTFPSFPTRTEKGVPYWAASMFMPGLGQVCQFRVGMGALWLVLVIALVLSQGYWPAGLLAHVACVLDAFLHRRRPILPYGIPSRVPRRSSAKAGPSRLSGSNQDFSP